MHFRNPFCERDGIMKSAKLVRTMTGWGSMALAVWALHGGAVRAADGVRERILMDDDWRFIKGDPPGMTTNLTLLQVRTPGRGGRGPATATAPVASAPAPVNEELWPYILATSNDFIGDPAKRVTAKGTFDTGGIAYAAPEYSDGSWERVDLPHDFGIAGPFIAPGPESDGNTGRLPYFGKAWYRKALEIPAADAGKQIYLDIDGAMSYAMVFCNGKLVGGWPYGYASWRVDLTPHIKAGGANTLAIRVDNPPNSSRWYPGGGIYRNVWLTKTSPVHVGQWGTFVTTPKVAPEASTVQMTTWIDNDSKADVTVDVSNDIFMADSQGQPTGTTVAPLTTFKVAIAAGTRKELGQGFNLANAKLWSPKSPNRYVAVTRIEQDGKLLDTYQTPFGIREVKFDPNRGMLINGEVVKMNGVCDHHDLGALGAAVNFRALQRQLQMLQDMGCNAIRTSHNPPTPELLDLADQMGFVVMDEAFDAWSQTKRPNDYARIYAQWHEQDMRMLVRRDRNHPSVVMWSIGNEIGEQGNATGGAEGAELGRIVHEEDPTRPFTSAMNSASAGSALAAALEIEGLNYQGAVSNQYPVFHQRYPEKMVFGSETESTITSRGEYFFPVPNYPGNSSQRNNSIRQISSYDLSTPGWGSIPDREFLAQDTWPFVGGQFTWTGFDYIGEPTPWGGANDTSRSSYFGIIDLAGFPKDRFYIYQAHWRPDYPMVHILPHWNWPERAADPTANPPTAAQVTPVHVYTSGDEAELFLNGKSLGRKKKVFENVVDGRSGQPMQIAGKPINGMPAYRIRWDDVAYVPGELKVVAYKNGKEWATETVKTTGPAAKLVLKPDRAMIAGDGHDLSFVTVAVADKDGLMVPRAGNKVTFEVSGPGEIVATDNGDPTDLTVFGSKERKAFNGLALAIVKGKRGATGAITVTARAEGLEMGRAVIVTR
jgi:beta-galactosidase